VITFRKRITNMILMHLNMDRLEITLETLDPKTVLGGRALIDYMLTERGSATAHPLSPESLFVAAPGFFAGTGAPQSGRLSIGGKSPLTGGIKEANVGGTAGHMLGKLGIQGILAQGHSETLKVLVINRDGARLEDAGDIHGLLNYEACDRLRDRYGEKIGIIVTGPAGEMLMANSTVAVTDMDGRPSRHAGRGGLGAVMASKGLKAVIVDAAGTALRKPARPGAFKEAKKRLAEAILAHPSKRLFHRYGTPFLVDLDNKRGSMPSYNHRAGAFDKVDNLCVEALDRWMKAHGGRFGHGCMPGCLVRCSPVFHDEEGNHLTSGYEYETIAMMGANLGIDDHAAIARMDRKCDELGLDTIEFGCTVGVLNDAGLFEFGDVDRVEFLLREVEAGSYLGRILGSGVEAAAKVFGIHRVPAVKGQGIPGHSARSVKGWGVTYATSPQGADHTTGIVHEEPLSPEGQVERSLKSQIIHTAMDATGLCNFTFMTRTPELFIPLINALYGVDWDLDAYYRMGETALRQELAFNRRAGIGPGKDRLPDWMMKEPLPPTNAVFDVPSEEMENIFKGIEA
jgi:aldehyde:ferredoxin oxidoreductase